MRETADRIYGKRLKAALSSFVESMEPQGHLDLDEKVRRHLLAASASTRPTASADSGQSQQTPPSSSRC